MIVSAPGLGHPSRFQRDGLNGEKSVNDGELTGLVLRHGHNRGDPSLDRLFSGRIETESRKEQVCQFRSVDDVKAQNCRG